MQSFRLASSVSRAFTKPLCSFSAVAPTRLSSFSAGPSLNSVSLIGRIGMDPELRVFGNDQQKVSMVLATDRVVGTGDERKKYTQWHKCCFFNNEGLTRFVDENVTKGTLCYVHGRLEYYKSKDGTKYVTEIRIEQLKVLRKSQAQMAEMATNSETVWDSSSDEHVPSSSSSGL